MKKRLVGIIGMMVLTVGALSGCSGKSEKTEEVSEDFKKIVDEYENGSLIPELVKKMKKL